MIRLLDFLVAGLALAALAWLGLWAVERSPHQPEILEARLQTAVDTAVETAGLKWAKIEVDGQRAIIKGPAPSPDAVQEVAALLLNVQGQGGLIFGGITQIESQVGPAAPVSPYVWRAIKTETGKIVLLGHVPSAATRDRLLAEATELAGDAGVDDQLVLAAGVPEGNWQGIARLALQHVAELDMGEGRLEDHVLSVKGVAMKDDVRARISADVSNIAAPFRGEPVIRGASLWAAQHKDKTLILSGRVASETERAEINRIAKRFFAGDVRDEMAVVAAGPENWIDGVKLGLPHFAQFKSGKMDFDPKGGGFMFEGEATGSTLAYLREDMAKLTGPYGVAIAADTVTTELAEIDGIDFKGDPRLACEAAFNRVLAANKVVFTTGKADITRDSGVTLDKLMAVSALCDPALRFELGGHTDTAGERVANLALSEARAKAVAEYMIAAGIARARLSAIGYGPDVPVGRNDTIEGRAENRRIEFKVLERSN